MKQEWAKESLHDEMVFLQREGPEVTPRKRCTTVGRFPPKSAAGFQRSDVQKVTDVLHGQVRAKLC